MPPPSSATHPTIPWPTHRSYASKAQAGAVTGTETFLWQDPIGGKFRQATVGAHSKTSLTLNVPGATPSTIVFDLTGDASVDIPIVIGNP
jgi:hypothetical protein